MIPRFPPVLALTNEGSKACRPNMVSAKRQRRSRAPRPSRKPPRGRNPVRSAAARRQGRQAPATTRGELLDRLARLGLAQQCGPSALVLVGHDAELACLVFRWMEGARADEMLDRGAGSLAAEWVRNGACRSRRSVHYGAKEMVRDLTGWTDVIAAAHPGLGQRAAQLVERPAQSPPQVQVCVVFT